MQELPFDPSSEEGILLGLGVMAIVLIPILIGLAINILICFLIYSGQKRVPEEHRELEPVLVWLLLIPCFHFIWNFVVFPKVSRSMKSYFDSEEDYSVGDCGAQMGLFYAISVVATLIPYLNCIALLAGIVFLIIYVIKITELKSRLPEPRF